MRPPSVIALVAASLTWSLNAMAQATVGDISGLLVKVGSGSGQVKSVPIPAPSAGQILVFTGNASSPFTVRAIQASDVTGILSGANGGTGVNNSGKTLTLGGSYTISGTTGSTLNIGSGGTLGAAAFVGTTVGGNGVSDDGKALVLSSGGFMGGALLAAGTVTGAKLAGDAYPTASGAINAQTGTTYTLQASDNGRIVVVTNASAITVTIASGLPAGFTCQVIQGGAGVITFTASSTTVNSFGSLLSTAGQYAAVSVVSPSSNSFILAGNLQ